jgi:hypothetical protein
MYMPSPTINSRSKSRSRSRSPTTSSPSKSREHIVDIDNGGREMGEPSGRGNKTMRHRKHKKHKKHKKHNTRRKCPKSCKCKDRRKCKRPCRCNKKTKHRRKHRGKHRRKHSTRKKRQRGGSKMLNPSNYPNPFPKGGPWNPNSISNGLDKGYFYKNNTNPYLPNPKNTRTPFSQSGGSVYNLAKNIPGGSDMMSAYWTGMNGAKNMYQSWIGGKAYPSPNPTDQPIDQQGDASSSSPPDLNAIFKKSQSVASAYV